MDERTRTGLSFNEHTIWTTITRWQVYWHISRVNHNPISTFVRKKLYIHKNWWKIDTKHYVFDCDSMTSVMSFSKNVVVFLRYVFWQATTRRVFFHFNFENLAYILYWNKLKHNTLIDFPYLKTWILITKSCFCVIRYCLCIVLHTGFVKWRDWHFAVVVFCIVCKWATSRQKWGMALVEKWY